MAGVTEEVGKAVGGITHVLGQQPLSLALVIMNLVLLGYLFYVGTSSNSQRKETTELIVGWQKDTDKLMASCVSQDVTRMMLDNMQRITDTMLSAEQKEIARMQEAIREERNRSWELREREKKELDELKKRQSPTPEPQSLKPNRALSLPPLPMPPVLLNLVKPIP